MTNYLDHLFLQSTFSNLGNRPALYYPSHSNWDDVGLTLDSVGQLSQAADSECYEKQSSEKLFLDYHFPNLQPSWLLPMVAMGF